MKNSDSTNTQGSPQPAPPQEGWFSPWQRLKTKRISYLTLPLLFMATVTEFVILATGWKYQKVVCLPQGMGVTFFGIGPIGATILAVELLKLPLAIWTASRHGWVKGFMLVAGLPLICVLTFQLVKDMAVYEMGVAMTPASQMLDKAMAEDIRIDQLKSELAGIEAKKTEREKKLAELAAKQAKAKTELEDSLKRNDDSRKDAVNLTDYQKKELSDVENRETIMIAQFNADTDQLNKALADLRARRDVELARDSKWNAEEARIENAYKAKLSDYTNKKAAYEKAKAEYDSANFVKRELMKEPVSPGVPPVRETNTQLKSSALADLDVQIKAKEAELLTVNTKRRDQIAQVEADARRLRDEYDHRSTTRREETDKKRDELTAALTALTTEWKAEQKQIDQDLAAAVQKVDGIRTELDAASKKAQGFYEERETDIRKTQVHRIATTVEIIRGLIKGERPMSIKATAKERGDILTDQISMVRIWVYPVLAFIVAFLPTLMVEIGFTTVFKPEQQRPAYRLGFCGRRLHWLYTRAGRQKILRAERLASEATGQIAVRDKALATAKAVAAKAVTDKETEVQAAEEAMSAAAAEHEELLKKKQEEHAAQLENEEEQHAAQLKRKEEEWVAKLAGMADSLNRTVVEKDALRDLQKSEIERQIQMRQNAWSERLTSLRQELDSQRASSEAERTSMVQEHHKKLLEVSEDCKNQVAQARRQAADGELAGVETTARLTHDLKEAEHARETAEAQLRQQTESFAVKLTQAKEDASREIEKAARQEKHRVERQQLEIGKTMRQKEENLEQKLKQREQELSLAFDARLAEEQTRIEQEARRREAELERQFEARALEVDARWKQEVQQREEAAQVRLKQREQQLQAQADSRVAELQTQAEQELRRIEAESERQFEAQSRDANTRMKQELQQRELAFEAKVKQREQELAIKASARETELQNQWNSDLRVREEDWERQAQSRVRAAETRLASEAQQKEELFLSKTRQRDQQWQVKMDALRAELLSQAEEALRRRELEADANLRDLEAQLRKEMQQKEEATLVKARQREQELEAQLTAQAQARQMAAQAQWDSEAEKKMRAAVEPLKALLARTEKERDEARMSSTEGARQVQNLEKKLTEASSFLSTWRNGKNLVGTSSERS
jgi:hypothetical protein